MSYKILFFGVLTDITKQSKAELQADGFAKVEDIEHFFVEKYPKFGTYKYKIAVNKQMVEGDYNLSDNDEIAFLPPFAGG